MSDEHDSWFSNTFGVDLGGAAKRLEDEARAAAKRIEEEARAAKAQVTNIVQTVQKKVDGVIDDVVNTATGVVKKAAGVAGGGGAGGGAPKPAAKSGGGTGKFPLSGSVGNGGQNDPNDVKAVQQALGVAVDGQCGGGTIRAIEEFQRSIGQSKPDGRVDAGGATERALSKGGKGAATGAAGESGDLLDKALAGAKGLAGGLAGVAGGLPGKAIEGAKEIAGGLGGGLAGGLGDAGGLLGDAAGAVAGAVSSLGGAVPKGGAANSLPSLFDSYGGEVTFAEKSLGKKSLGKYFELEAKVGGSIKFGSSNAGPNPPPKAEVEKSLLEYAKSVFDEGVANFKTETGTGIKPNATKDGRGVGIGGAVTIKTSLGPLTLEFATVEVSLVNFDPKKGISGPKLSASTSRSLGYKKTIKGIELEGAIAVTLSGELTPDYLGIGQSLAANAAVDVIIAGSFIVIGIATIAGATYQVAFGLKLKDLTTSYRGNLDSLTNGFRAGMSDSSPPGDGYGQEGFKFGQENLKKLIERTKGENPQATDEQVRMAVMSKADEATKQLVATGQVERKLKEGMWNGLLADGKWLFTAKDAATAFQACGLGNDPRFDSTAAKTKEWQAYLKQYPVQSQL